MSDTGRVDNVTTMVTQLLLLVFFCLLHNLVYVCGRRWFQLSKNKVKFVKTEEDNEKG